MASISRRRFVSDLGTGLSALAIGGPPGAGSPPADGEPWTRSTRDERYWARVRRQFRVPPGVTHLNTGGVAPTLAAAQDRLTHDLAALMNGPFYAYESDRAPELEIVRGRLARSLGVHAADLAFTRNATESMHVCQFGLDLRAGDEVVVTSHEFHRMMGAWRRREARDGIRIRVVDVPWPLTDRSDLIQRVRDAISDQTRVLSVPHMVDVTGQVLPIRALADVAHERETFFLVDGAQAVGHIETNPLALGADAYAMSLHKWLCAPPGTGLLWLSPDAPSEVWPLIGGRAEPGGTAAERFEDLGADLWIRSIAALDALEAQESIGLSAKTQRLRRLRDRWLGPVLRSGRVRPVTDVSSRNVAGGMASVALVDASPSEVRDRLWSEHRIRIRAIERGDFQAIRVAPGLHSDLADLDRFVEALLLML